MMSVIEGLRGSAKGQLKYDIHWKPTARTLDECTSPPRVSAAFQILSLQDRDQNSDLLVTKNLGDSSDISKSPANKTQVDNDSVKKINGTGSSPFTALNITSQSTEVVETIHMDISVAIHHYDSKKKREAIEKSQSRREIFDEHSRKLKQEKQRDLEELQEIKEQQFLKAVEAIQKDERKRTAEVNKRQEKLCQDHQEHAARAVRKVKQAEEWRKKIEEEDRNKQEIEKLDILVQQLKTTALDVHKSFKEYKHQKHLPAATSEVLHEMDKILQMSAETVENAKRNGKPSEKENKLVLQFGEIMRNMINKSKLLISEAQAKVEREQAELEAKLEAEKARKAAEAQKSAAAQAQNQDQVLQTVNTAKSKQNSTLPAHLLDCVSESAFKEYSKLEKLLEDTSKAADVLISDKAKQTKQYRFDLQKAVTTPVNAISDQSPSHLLDKIQRLTNLLSGKSVQASGRQVSANSHSAGQAYCRELLAKKLVMQGSQQVSTSHNSAFPIAAVAIAMSAAFPEVRHLIMGHFYKQCPFLVPFYIPKTEGTSDEDYYKSLGYVCTGGTIEPPDKFLKRMTGLVRLYAAIISSLPPPGVTDHPFGLELGWRFLARILNLRPRQDFTATAIYEFLDVAGHALQKQYGMQFWKLLHVLVRDYLPKINDVTVPAQSGPVVRLKGFLEGCIKNRSIKIPDGYLTTRWWKSSSGGFGY